MKKILITITLVAASAATTAQAEQTYCEYVSELAGLIMDNRQNGVEMSKQIKAAEGDSITISLVEEAYDRHRYSAKNLQKEEITSFKNDWYRACYQYYKES